MENYMTKHIVENNDIFVENKRKLASICTIRVTTSSIGKTKERKSQEELSFDHSQLWELEREGCAAPLGSNQSRMRTEVPRNFERSHLGVVRERHKIRVGARVKHGFIEQQR